MSAKVARACVAAAASIAGALVLGLLTPQARAATPVLAGPWSSGQQGYGRSMPRSIFNGGDPTGKVGDIEWLSWGGARAIGVGVAFYVAPGQITAAAVARPAVVVLFKLGYCHHRRAYDAIHWYFPGQGERFSTREYINACSGRYVGVPLT